MEDCFDHCVYDNDFVRGFHSSMEEDDGKSNISECISKKFYLEAYLQEKLFFLQNKNCQSKVEGCGNMLHLSFIHLRRSKTAKKMFFKDLAALGCSDFPLLERKR